MSVVPRPHASFAVLAAIVLTLAARVVYAGDDRDAGSLASSAPSGPWLVLAERRAPARVGAAGVRVCSRRVPVCVHAPPSAQAAALASLDALERGWAVLTGAMRIPPPDVDVDTGVFDVALERDVPGGWETRPVARDVRSAYDRVSAEASLDVGARPGCALDAAAFRALARASLYRASPSATEGVARAQVTYLATLAVPCATALLAPEAELFQRNADFPVASSRVFDDAPSAGDHASDPRRHAPASLAYAEGAALAWARLDWAFGRNPGDFVRATWMLAATKTPRSAARWQNEPDAFDVLATTFKGPASSGASAADVLLDVAIARAFLGDADDGAHQPELRVLGASARVTPDWEIDWPATPRRLAPRRPVAPTGASYVVVRTANAPPNARLRLEAAWEEHAFFRWAAVKVDASGHETARLVVPTRDRATETQMTVVELAGVDRVLLVAMNAGDPLYPFDPDDEVWEPHGWLLTLAAE